MLCSRCKKREAVVFLSKVENDQTINEGLCMICARELGLKQINDLLDKVKNSTDQDGHLTDEASKQFMEMLGGKDGDFTNPEALSTMQNMMKSILGLSSGSSDDSENSDLDIKLNLGLDPNVSTDQDTRESSSNNDTSNPSAEKKRKKEKKRKYLSLYCDDLTKKALDGNLDRIIGRDKEIYRVIQILNRRTKNNPCLIGEPGVGKTAIAEGIAIKIVEGKVPPRLADKEIFLLDLTALVAGTQFRGQFESRVRGLIEEVKNSGNIILFIDEVHNLVGTGDSEGTMNAANILKPALSRGEIQVIGATTFSEYRKYIEKDSALERRFQPVTIVEPTIEQTIDVLEGIKDYYQNHHKVKVPNNIIKQAVILSERYITDRFLPDKAIDLLDEACSCAALASKELNDHFQILKKILNQKDELDDIESDDTVNYERIAALKTSILKDEELIKKLENAISDIRVTQDDLAKVIELWTGIPADKIKETEFKKIACLEDIIKSKIIGQDEAVTKVSTAIRRSRVRLSEQNKPASFIFVGPTGVGKTELVKVLSSQLFDGVEPLIRLDMSEFMEKHAISRIIGSPPGYVGYDEAGQLTEKVRRRPYSVILLDEIEKAHPDIMNILLQILDEGKITDSHGRIISFANTVIIMTSNAGSNRKDVTLGFNHTSEQLSIEKARKSLSEFLKPEFIARVDEIIIFRELQKTDYEQISDLMLNQLKDSILAKNTKFEYTTEVAKLIADKAFGKKSGARDIQKVIRTQVEDKICTFIVQNMGIMPHSLILDVKDNELVLFEESK